MRAIVYTPGEPIPHTRLRYMEERPRKNPKNRRALFQCDCGKTIETDIAWVKFLNVTSCGCFKTEALVAKNLKHGHAVRDKKSGAYRSWTAMHQRTISHPNYINRPVCERWCGEEGFANFYIDMGDRPEGLTLERIDNNQGYEPGNCKWATRLEQVHNRG